MNQLVIDTRGALLSAIRTAASSLTPNVPNVLRLAAAYGLVAGTVTTVDTAS